MERKLASIQKVESEDDPVFQKAIALVDGFEKNEK